MSDIAYFTDISYSILISDKACEYLSNIFDLNDIELLPTKYEERKYFLLYSIKAYNVNYKVIQASNTKYKMIFYKKDVSLELSGNQHRNINNLVQLIIENISKNLIEENIDRIININIEYFYDGEFTDLGVKARIYNNITEKIEEKYFSFILHSKELESEIINYLSSFNENEWFFQLKLLAEKIKISLENKYYWLSSLKEITVQCYD